MKLLLVLSKPEACLSVKIKKTHFDALTKARNDWQNKGYSLITSDCVSFLSAIANAVGVKVPERRTWQV